MAGAVSGPTTWKEALAACGGDYVVARKKYKDVYENYMQKKEQS